MSNMFLQVQQAWFTQGALCVVSQDEGVTVQVCGCVFQGYRVRSVVTGGAPGRPKLWGTVRTPRIPSLRASTGPS